MSNRKSQPSTRHVYQIEKWQKSIEKTEQDHFLDSRNFPGYSLITELYCNCRQAWEVVLSFTSTADTELHQLASNEAGRFNIWGDGLAVVNGGLDEILDGIWEMQEMVVVLVASMVEQLMTCKTTPPPST